MVSPRGSLAWGELETRQETSPIGPRRPFERVYSKDDWSVSETHSKSWRGLTVASSAWLWWWQLLSRILGQPTSPVCLGLRDVGLSVLKWDSPGQTKGLVTLVVLHYLISPEDHTLATAWKTKSRKTRLKLIRLVRLVEYPGKRRGLLGPGWWQWILEKFRR